MKNILLVIIAVAALVACKKDDTKKFDASLLIGSWEQTSPASLTEGCTNYLTIDTSSYKVIVSCGINDVTATYSYTFDGSIIKVSFLSQSANYTVKNLTATELSVTDQGGTNYVYKKVTSIP